MDAVPILLLFDILHQEDAAQIARKVLAALSAPFVLGGESLSISASIGIAIYPEDGETISMLLRHADLAMYQAKEGGRDDFRFFGAPM